MCRRLIEGDVENRNTCMQHVQGLVGNGVPWEIDQRSIQLLPAVPSRRVGLSCQGPGKHSCSPRVTVSSSAQHDKSHKITWVDHMCIQ